MRKRFISVIVTFAIVLSTCTAFTVSASEKPTQPENFDEYSVMLENDGYSLKKTNLFSQEKFNFVTDEMVWEICSHIKSESGLDILGIITSFPSTNGMQEFVYATFNIDAAALGEKFFELRADMDESGKHNMAALYHYLGVYFSIIEECKAYCVPVEDNIYEIYLDVTTKDGRVETVGTGVMVNTETQLAYGKNGNGILGTGYTFSISELLLYSQVNMWVRDFGFCLFYDIFSYTTPFFFYETRRIKFDYDGLEWMIQLWKGNYLISNGAEVGIYTRDEKRFGSFYDCANDEQMMEMSMELYHGVNLIFSRPKQLHWWITGFRIDDTLYPSDEMTLKFSIEMKDEEMLKAFCDAIDKHYMRDVTYTVDGLTVNVVW